MNHFHRTVWALVSLVAVAACQTVLAVDAALPSWNEGGQASDHRIRGERDDGGRARFRPPAERIAMFDNDGTLWCEQPMYFQLIFAFDRVKAMRASTRNGRTRSRSSRARRRHEGAGATGEKGLLEIMAATQRGMTTEEFHADRQASGCTRRSIREFKRPYNQCIYQPMLELLAYLRANGFKTYIVSGGGVEFMRPWVEEAYGIPPEQVVGSSGVVKFENEGRQAGAHQGAEGRIHRRRPGQAGRHQPLHRPAADHGIRQLRRRPANAAVHHGRRGAAIRADRAPHGCRARVSPTIAHSHIGKLDKALDEAARKAGPSWI